MNSNLIEETIDNLLMISNEYDQSKKKAEFTEKEVLEIMELILRMKEKGMYLKKSVEMLAFRLGIPVEKVKTKIAKLLNEDPETKAIIYPIVKNSTKQHSEYYQKNRAVQRAREEELNSKKLIGTPLEKR